MGGGGLKVLWEALDVYGFGLSQNPPKGGLLYFLFQLLWPIKNEVYLVGLASGNLLENQELIT